MKTIQIAFLLACCLCSVQSQLSQKRPDPVPILKQISKQNDDGSYSFGYEAGDGSYKIETKLPNGEVQGKYGYVDDEGKVREVEYGAGSKSGFRPQGNGINVPPPSLNNEVRPGPLAEGEEDDGQYREDPSIYDSKNYRDSRPAVKASRRPAFQAAPIQPAYQQSYRQAEQNAYQQPAQRQQVTYQQPQYNDYQQQTYQPQTFQFRQTIPSFSNTYQQPSQNLDYQDYQPAQQSYSTFQNPSYQQPAYQQQYQTQAQPQYSAFNFHPSVRNFDIGTGSYSINYGR